MPSRRRSRRPRLSAIAALHPCFERLEPRWALSSTGLAELAGPIYALAEQESGLVGAGSSDLAGASFSTAHNLGELAGSREVRDSVGRTDSRDVYRFQLGRQAEVALRLDEISQDVDLLVYDGAGKVLHRSTNAGRQAESISRTFSPGTYYVAVTPFWQSTSTYRLSLSAPATQPAPADGAGNRLADAKDLGSLRGALARADRVGAQDTADFYRFHLDDPSRVDLALENLQADVDLFLMAADGSVISQSMAPGNQRESITKSLAAGDYFVLVRPWHGSESSYRLSLGAEQTGDPEPDGGGPLPEVPYFGGPNEWNLNSINAPEAWARGFTGEGIIAAVVDTGVDLTHPELVSNLWVNADEIPGNGRDDDGNGFIDDRRGWDFASGDNDPTDRNGHGTHVAGTIAAANDGHGATGVAPGATIMPVQVLAANGSGSTSSVAAGIRYAVDNGADLINLSLGGGYSSAILSALQYAAEHDVMVIAASGNRGAVSPDYPAAHSAALSNLLSVEAHTAADVKATFSNGAAGAVQVAAPGVDIYSTLAGGSFGRLSGTSMATPHVTGLAALALSANPSLTPRQLREIILEGADRAISGTGAAGGVNAAVTVARAAGLIAGQSSFAAAPSSVASISAASNALWYRSTSVPDDLAPLVTPSEAEPVQGSLPSLSEHRDARIRAVDEWFALNAPSSGSLGGKDMSPFVRVIVPSDVLNQLVEATSATGNSPGGLLPIDFDAVGRLPSTALVRLV